MDLSPWVKKTITGKTSPQIIGLSGAQGIGKSTLSGQLVAQLHKEGLQAITISIDDFYLTRQQQIELTEKSGNPYLKQRGYPGTHDLELALSTLQSLKAGAPTRVPRYDKSVAGGLGDRVSNDKWDEVTTPLDVIIFEGWFLGFIPTKKPPSQSLEEINQLLAGYQSLFALIDTLIYLKPVNLMDVIPWRVEAEKNRAALGQEAMTVSQANDYINKFVPAYELYRDSVRADLTILVDSQRQPVDDSFLST